MIQPLSRERLIALARAFRVLPIVEKVHAARAVRLAEEENARFLEAHPGKVLPPADLIRRTYGDPSLRHFENWGRTNAEEIASVLAPHLSSDRPKVAEWGCGLGRVGQHLPSDWDYTGFDIDPSSIGWCEANLKGTFHLNQPSPPLPCADAQFDAVFAISIYTHLSAEAHRVWPHEIARILKPGGVFAFTVHGAPQAQNLLGSERRNFDEGALVVRGGVQEGSRTYLAYHPQPYVDEVLLAPFKKLSGPDPLCEQTVYIGQKPS